jgi:hypothetical protein
LLHGYRVPSFNLRSSNAVASRRVVLERLDLVAIGSRVWILDAAMMEMAEKVKCLVWKMN